MKEGPDGSTKGRPLDRWKNGGRNCPLSQGRGGIGLLITDTKVAIAE